ncbi:CPBP family intramembrane glutamic endopeptidase [Terriglobus sp. TAA 43]|uniref:CPBP family intramembrane glutamic endopeptidase n=1 Tax=Terriglobus sp. TAA 43 TaxID=278961 RepID=UPI0006462E60|nr:type II CAAX endopeptidase family protein [Terriglobus sp. TAA 43]
MKRTAALLEVLGVYLAAGALEDRLIDLLTRFHIVSISNPFALLTNHTTNADLLLASHRLLLIWLLQYGSYFALIIPLNWWYRRRGPTAYGLTRAGHSMKWLIVAGIATACLCEWPVLILSLVDVVHPLGAMAPWRQAFFDTSWQRWQFWLFAGISSYAVVPVLEELLFRGYYQRRLAEDWGDAPAILGTSCLFVFAHKQYLIPNAYNVGMVLSLLCLAVGLGVIFAYTRSLIPSMIAHAIINVPLTPKYQIALLAIFAVGLFIFSRTGLQVVKRIFGNPPLASCMLLAFVGALYVVAAQHFAAMTTLSIVVLVVAIGLEWTIRKRSSAHQT